MTTITKQVKQGDSVSIQATPKTGYTFSGWTSGAGDSRISTDNPYTFTPNADTSINAVFSEATPIISWVGNPGNLVIKNSNGQTHNLWSAAGTNKYFGDVEGFGADDIVSVYINDPDSTSRIPTTTWLTSINMNGLTNLTLQKRSFAYCTGLTSVVLPNSSYSIADTVSGTSGAFQGCTSLSSLSLGGCTSIGSYSFQGCTSLGTVNLPSSCTSIGNHAFESCSSLQTLNFASSGSSLSIGILAFSNCDIRSIEFPSYLTEIVESTYGTCVDIANRPNKNNACNPFQGNTNLTSITKTINTGRYRAEGNCLIDSQYLPNAASGDTSYYNAVIIGCKNSIIPDTGSSPSRIPGAIGAAAFMNMGITSITIPERIRYIESYAFYNNRNLSSISFSPDTGIIVNPYLRICGNAFGYCTSLSTITFPSRLKQFGNTYANGSSTYYSPDVFYNCSALRTAHLESIATPPSIISGPSFSGENLFPSTIEKIYVKPGTMQAYQSDSKWAYWYNQKKLYIGIGISSDVSPAGSSTVSKSSDSVEFQSDSAAPKVILTATPTTGYTFSSWKRGSTVLSTSNPYTATVVDDGTGIDEFTALSTVASYSISASINPSGGGTVSGTGTYNYGDSCTVSATANTGYNFVNWTEGGSTVSSSSSYTFTVSQARTLVANFELQTITISAGPNTSGYGTVSGNSGTYSYGDTVSLTATAASGYEFSEWTENGTTVSTSSTYSFTATQDRTLVAVFVVATPKYNVQLSVDPNSSVSPAPTLTGGGSYPAGTDITISIPSGYYVNRWWNTSEEVSDETSGDTYTVYSLDGKYQDANSFTYTVGNEDTTIYCTCSSVPQNAEMYCLYSEDQYALPPSLDLYDSTDNLLDTWSGDLTSGNGSTYDNSSVIPNVYKIKLHATEHPADEYGNPAYYEYPRMEYLDSLDLRAFSNLHTIDFDQESSYYDESTGETTVYHMPSYISASSVYLPASCVEVRYIEFQPGYIYDNYGNQQEHVPSSINFGNVQTAYEVSFCPYIGGSESQPQSYPNCWWERGGGICTESITTLNKPIFIKAPITILDLPNISGTYYGAKECISLTSATIPSSCTTIGVYALGGCTELTSVSIPNTITTIGQAAFKNTGITSVSLPSSLTSLSYNSEDYGDGGSFEGCTSLTSVSLPDTLTSLGWATFKDCTSLTSITLPSALTTTGNRVFYGCTNLTTVNNMPSTLTRLGNNLFYNCSHLANITLPSSLTIIGSYTFYRCTSLTGSITLPSSLTDIYSNAYYGCTGITSVSFPSTLNRIYDYAFANCTGLTSVSLPDTLTNLSGGAFKGCTGLTSFTIPSSITTVRSGLLEGCTNITTVNLHNSITILEGSVFKNCTSLASITLPSSLTTINGYAFQGCPMTSLSLPSSLRALFANALAGMTSITSFSIPSGITTFGTGIFNGDTSLTTVSGLDNLSCITNFTNMFKGCTSFNGSYTNPDTGHTVFKVPSTVNASNLTSAFNGCTSLTGVLLPGKAMSGGTTSTSNPGIFEGCTNLKYVEFQTGGYFSTIGYRCFYNCQNLETFPNIDNITSLGKGAFYNCKSITATTINIPTTITSIPESCFYCLWKNKKDQTVRYIYVPYTCQSINKNAFAGVGGPVSKYDWDDWDDDGKPRSTDIFVDMYGPVAIEIGDSTHGSNLITNNYSYGISQGAFSGAHIYSTDSYIIDSDDLDDENPTKTSGGQGYLKFYGTNCPKTYAYSSSQGSYANNVFNRLDYDMGDTDATYIPKIYVKSASLSSYQTGLSTYISNNQIELTTF